MTHSATTILNEVNRVAYAIMGRTSTRAEIDRAVAGLVDGAAKLRALGPDAFDALRPLLETTHLDTPAARVARWDPALRYFRDAPLTLSGLVGVLDDDDCRFAGWALIGMTGERHGFDHDADAVANATAIAIWRERVRALEPGFTPGGWYYLGAPTPSASTRQGP